jgi:hypothetical protein
MTPESRHTGVEGNSANGAMLSPTPPMIEVASGGFVDLLNPDPSTLVLADIARGMAYTCRYGGHIKRFYSVAEHAVLVHDLLRDRGAGPDTCRWALFHDAAEAFLGDVVAPLKWALRYTTQAENAHYQGGWPPDGQCRSAYDVLSDRMENAIVDRFDIDRRMMNLPDVGIADMWALRIEARALTATGGAHWRWPGELPLDGEIPTNVIWSGGLDPEEALAVWLKAVEINDRDRLRPRA